jgi:hypothetical protein
MFKGMSVTLLKAMCVPIVELPELSTKPATIDGGQTTVATHVYRKRYQWHRQSDTGDTGDTVRVVSFEG